MDKDFKKIESILDSMFSNAENGIESPLTCFAFLREIEKKSKSLKEKILSSAIEEGSYYNDKTFEHESIIFEKVPSKPRYDYKHIEEWVNQKAILSSIEKKYQTAYKQASQGKQYIDEETGELVEDQAKASFSKESFSVKFSK